MNLVAVGECTIDRYLDLGLSRVGGISLNVAVNARRLGAHASLVSCIGADAEGVRVMAVLDRAGVGRSHLHQVPGATAEQDIRLGPFGERTFPPGGYRSGVLETFRLTASDLAFIRQHDLVAVPYFQQIRHLSEAILTDAALVGKRVVDLLDGTDLGPGYAGLESVLARSDLTFLSSDPAVAGVLLAERWPARGPLVVTHGALGCSVLIRGQRVMGQAVGVPPEECRDSTGCGDAFQAAFAIEYFATGSIDRAIVAGAELAATVLRHVGAVEDE